MDISDEKDERTALKQLDKWFGNVKEAGISEIIRGLHRMNINRATLFPGLEGFSEALGITDILLHKC